MHQRSGAAIWYSADRIPALCQMFLADRHCRRRSTHRRVDRARGFSRTDAEGERALGRVQEAEERVRRAVTILADIGAGFDELRPEIWKLTEW